MKRASCMENGHSGKVNGLHDTSDASTNGNANHDRTDQPPPMKRAQLDEPEERLVAKELQQMELSGVAHDKHIERIAILDFGAQYGKVIDRRVREANVLSEMFPLKTKASEILAKGNFRGIIISGGPNSVYDPKAPQVDPEVFTCGIPVLGICYGFQLLNKEHGGAVSREKIREDGQCIVEVDVTCPLFEGLYKKQKVLLTHGDSVSQHSMAEGFKVVATSGKHVAGICNEERQLYGVQFHPEVDLTEEGKQMFDNFLFRICQCTGGYTMRNREQMCIDEIRQVVGNKKVLVMVSGGVDSTVCAALLHRALGENRVTAVHIDNGFMRYKESDQVVQSLNELNLKVHRYDCSLDFMGSTVSGTNGEGEVSLDNAREPEVKRHIIGNAFIRCKDRIMDQLKLNKDDYFLAQGTLRPDLIESASCLASGHADTIKTHHNDTELVRQLRAAGRVIEPLRDFHKDEVRELGTSLGLPEEIVQRHPFPGPGLAIRILCADRHRPYRCADFDATHQALNILTNLSADVKTVDGTSIKQQLLNMLEGWDIEELKDQPYKISATLLPIKTVGVQGDSRSYSYVAALSTNHLPIPWERLARYASIIPKVLHNINRVTYVFGKAISHPMYTVTETLLSIVTTNKLRKADLLANLALFGRDKNGKKDRKLEDMSRKIQQMPVVLIPCDFDRDPKLSPNSYLHSIVLRPFITSDFMTGVAALPTKHIPEKNVLEMVDRIQANVLGISRVMIDLTSKPPGTTEWE